MAREVQTVFPGVDVSDMLIVPTCQQAVLDLVRTGEKVDTEKDRLLERVRFSCCGIGVMLATACTAGPAAGIYAQIWRALTSPFFLIVHGVGQGRL
jgi:hypothetical protein